MKILVTGAAGFIGYHTTQRLLNDGHTVFGIDNLLTFRDKELKQVRLSLLGIGEDASQPGIPVPGTAGFTFIRQDILDRPAMMNLCIQEQFDCIIHLAAVAGTGLANAEPLLFADHNITGTANVLEAARQSHVSHVFFSSSAVVHGVHAHAPLREDDDVNTPLSMYAASKRAAELLCYSYAQAYGIPVTVFRFFTVFGAWGRPDSLPMQLAHSIMEGKEITVMNNGYMVRDFTYIDDITDGILSALSNPPYATLGAPPYALYNIGSSKPVSYLSFIQSIEMALGRTAKIRREPTDPITCGETVEAYADTSKMESQLAYSPAWDYAEAIPQFTNWFRENYNITFHI